MKKLITIATLAFACGRGPAGAAKLCFNAAASATTMPATAAFSDWYVGTNSFPSAFFVGEGCAQTSTYAVGGCTTSLYIGRGYCLSTPNASNFSSNANTNVYCHCKLLYPYPGPLTYIFDYTNYISQYADLCSWGNECALRCANAIKAADAAGLKILGLAP